MESVSSREGLKRRMSLLDYVGGAQQQFILVFGDVPGPLIVMMFSEVPKRIGKRQARVRLPVRHQRCPR